MNSQRILIHVLGMNPVMLSLKLNNVELNSAERVNWISHFTITGQGRRSTCRASKMFQESVEALALDRKPGYIEPNVIYTSAF